MLRDNKWFLMVFVLSSSVMSYAQDKLNGGIGYFSPGIQIINAGSLNSELNSYGYPGIKDGPTLSFGGDGGVFISNFYIGGEGHGLNFSNSTNATYTTRFTAGYGLFNIGYAL